MKNNRGQSLVEYLVIVALVAVGSIGLMRVVSQTLNNQFAHVAKSLGAEVDGKITRAKVQQNYLTKKNLRNFMTGAGSAKDVSNDDTED